MTFEELKTEADKLGYRLIKKSPPVKMLPCVCGRKRLERWFTFDGMQFYKCPTCERQGEEGHSCQDAKRKWNEMITKERKSI